MSHILVIGGGLGGLTCALSCVSKGLTATLIAPKPILHNRAIGSANLSLPDEVDRKLRRYGAQYMNGHEVLATLLRQSRAFVTTGRLTILPYRRLISFCRAGNSCVGGIVLNELTETLEAISADAVVLAAGKLDPFFRTESGNAATAFALHAGAALENGDLPEQIGISTDGNGQTTLPGLFAVGACTSYCRSAAEVMHSAVLVTEFLSAQSPRSDEATSAQAAATALSEAQQVLDAFRAASGTRSALVLTQHLHEAIVRALPAPRAAAPLTRGLLDVRVLRQQACRGGFDLGAGAFEVLRAPSLITFSEACLLTAAYRMTQADGRLTACLQNGEISIQKEAF